MRGFLSVGSAFVSFAAWCAAEVVIPDGAEPSSRLAAVEFTNYVFKATGRMLPVREGVPDERTKVVIGTLARLTSAPAAARKALLAEKSPEASWSGKTDGRLWLIGKDEVAELYAVYHFLETKMGVRWFRTPDAEDSGEDVPHLDRLPVPECAEVHAPAFHERMLGMSCAIWLGIPTNSVPTAVRNGFQVGSPTVWWESPDAPPDFKAFYSARTPRWMRSLGGGHGTFDAFLQPREKIFAEHPDWFALVDGKRVNSHHVCFSNLRLLDFVADGILRKFAAADGKGSFLFGMSDFANGYCECPACRAWDPPGLNDGKAVVDVSRRFRKAVRIIAEKVYAAYPKADLVLWAYANYREPPVPDEVDPRMRVQFCTHGRCYGHGIEDSACARNAKMLDLIRRWQAVSSDVATYEYFTCTPPLYVCRELSEARDIRAYWKRGLTGWRNEFLFSDSRLVEPWRSRRSSREMNASNWQWLYVTGHLLWNPELDAEKLLDEVEARYYGVAYPEMRRYQALRRKLWEASPFCMGYPADDSRRPTLLNAAGARDELFDFLNRAERLARGDRLLLHRISLDRRWLEDYWVKPNDEMKAKAGKAVWARQLEEPMKVDGTGADVRWAGAAYVSDFASAVDGNRTALPAELATSVGILADKGNLYFLFSAKEPTPDRMKLVDGRDADVWAGDSIEVFLYPPSVDNRVCHIAVNARGAVFDESDPGGVRTDDFGVEAHGRILSDRYAIELKVPVKKIAPLRSGETWKVLFARNRTIRDRFSPQGGCWSIDGCGYRDTSGYRPMIIGSSNIANGSFDRMDEKGKPVGWAVSPPGAQMVKSDGNVAVEIRSGYVFQMLSTGAFAQKPVPRKMCYSFRGSGKGSAKVFFFRYHDPDSEAQTGVGRKFLPTVEAGCFPLTAESRLFQGEYKIAADEWVAIAFTVGASGDCAVIDDVSAVLVE